MNTTTTFNARLAANQATSESFVAFLKSGSHVAMKAAGTSMIPYLLPFDKLVVRPLGNDEQLCKGTIVVLRTPWSLVAHRLVSDGFGGLITCGDSMLNSDEYFGRSEIVGVVEAYVRFGFKLRTNGLSSLFWRWMLFGCAPISYRLNNFLAKVYIRLRRIKWALFS